MNAATLSRSLSATAAVALLAAPCLHADFDHAAEDEFAAAAAALAPKFDPERDGITIEKILAQQAAAAKAASGKQSAKKGMKKPKKETAKSKGGKKKDKGGNKKNNKPKKPKKPAKTKKPAAGNTAKATIVTGNGPDARLVFITHTAREADVQATVRALRELDVVKSVGGLLRVIGD